jgi:outer membrane protein assembly factor BamB
MLRRTLSSVTLVSALAVLTACSSGPKRPDPTPLKPVTALVPATLVWQAGVGAIDPLMTPVVQAGQIFVANAAGVVSAIDGASGRVLWRQDVGAALSAGVGSDGRLAAVVTRNNELVAMSADGPLWRVPLTARVFTAPMVAGERVFVLSADRSVSAYDGKTGARLWLQPARGADPLVLQQPGVLLAAGNTLLAGVSGRLVGLNPLNGRVLWDTPIASPRGVNEIERLVDLVGPAGRMDTQVCVRAFQSTVGCVDTLRGNVLWTQPADGGVGLHADTDRLYGVESSGRVLAWRRSNGERVWAIDSLLHRGLTAPLAAGRSIVVGDAQGFVHLLSRDDGSLLNRLSTDGSPVVHRPVLVGQTLVALTRNGGVFAWRPE